MSDFKKAMKIIDEYALKMGWVFEHDKESVDVHIALANMTEMLQADELPSEVRPAYRIAMHSLGELYSSWHEELHYQQKWEA